MVTRKVVSTGSAKTTMEKGNHLKSNGLASLKELIELRFNELEKRLVLRDEATSKALTLATGTMERRLEGMNEFREQLRSQAGTFVTRESIEPVMNAEKERVRALELWKSNIEGRIIMIAVGLPLFFAVFQVALKVLW